MIPMSPENECLSVYGCEAQTVNCSYGQTEERVDLIGRRLRDESWHVLITEQLRKAASLMLG
jgi:hypothetical protein